MATITTDEAEELVDEGIPFVDVRTVEEFEDGHVPGAINVPVSVSGPGGMQPNPDFVRVMEACFEKNQKFIVACRAGGRSKNASQQLSAAGYQNVLDMEAGWMGSKNAFGEVMLGWQPEGREVETTSEDGQTYAACRKKAGLD